MKRVTSRIRKGNGIVPSAPAIIKRLDHSCFQWRRSAVHFSAKSGISTVNTTSGLRIASRNSPTAAPRLDLSD
jgi:hypothetical protein